MNDAFQKSGPLKCSLLMTGQIRFSSSLVLFIGANMDSDSSGGGNHRYIHMHFFCSSDIKRVS